MGREIHAAYSGLVCIFPGKGSKAPDGPIVVTIRVVLPPGLTEVDESEQFTPWPVGAEQLSVTGLLNPPTLPMATLKVAVPPGKRGALAGGDTATEKSGKLKVAPTL
jgi:hypothetical protein